MEIMNEMWSCIVVTCSTLSSVKAAEKEIRILKKSGRIPKSLPVLTVEDPAHNIGSGAATLNALLVATEYLSSLQNYMVITSDVLLEARILILHNGRKTLYSCSEKAFISLPLEYFPKSKCGKVYASGFISNFEAALKFIEELSIGSPPGVWVCSTDMMILYDSQRFNNLWENIKDVVMFCIPADITYATGHGVVSVDKENCVSEIHYCSSFEFIKNLAQEDEKVPLVSGIVFLNTTVAESLLTLNAHAPLDSCTYLGLDSGNVPIQVSLFFDILVAMCSNMDKNTFLSGNYGKCYNTKFGIGKDSFDTNIARSFVWKELSKYKMSARILTNCEHLYWSSHDCPEHHMKNLFRIAQSQVTHSFYKVKDSLSQSSEFLLMNSNIQVKSFNAFPGAIISDCSIEAESLNIGENGFISGLTFMNQHSALTFPRDIVVNSVPIKNGCESHVIVVLGTQENPFVPIDVNKETFCNKSWIQQMEYLKIKEHELWSEEWIPQQKTLANAKLFSPHLSFEEVLHLFCSNTLDSTHSTLLKRWKAGKRLSINEIIANLDVETVLSFRRNLYAEISCKIIMKVLCNNEDLCILPYFKAACATKWYPSVMNTLDNILLSDQNSVVKTRTLSCMADLMSFLAGATGGLRSGPGNNPAWEKAFKLLSSGSIVAGIKALIHERSNWMDRPDLLMRAARHYERAAQILIQNSVKTIIEFIIISPSKLPEFGTTITAECPARIDIQGGWSDTPPICYELGGSVVNIAVLVDGKKPIGAETRRLSKPHIHLKMRTGDLLQETLIEDVKDILNYNQPNAKGALLKAAIICTEIIDSTSSLSLCDQLISKFNGGFEIYSWSLLPQGCGMGTSSILAGAIVAALWSITGKQFTKFDIIHSVLLVEQLLTTGGGWQDQVSGILGGINRGYSDPELPLKVKAEPLILLGKTIEILNAHFLLLYTGKVRLAKNLLQNVIRNWYAREETVVKCFKDLLFNSLKMKNALLNGDLSSIGDLMNQYWEQKKILAPGCEPVCVKEIMQIIRPLCYGQLLVGAGGGGFMCVLTKEPNAEDTLKSALKENKEFQKMSIHRVQIDQTGLEVFHKT